jgi:hypothetical protein
MGLTDTAVNAEDYSNNLRRLRGIFCVYAPFYILNRAFKFAHFRPAYVGQWMEDLKSNVE